MADLGTRFQVLDDSRDTITANASTTPHRHFSHIKWRIETVQPPFDAAALPFSSPAPLLFAGDPEAGVDVDAAVERVSAEDDELVGGIRALIGVDADGDAGDCAAVSDEGCDAIPRSFWPMLGKSRAIGVQY